MRCESKNNIFRLIFSLLVLCSTSAAHSRESNKAGVQNPIQEPACRLIAIGNGEHKWRYNTCRFSEARGGRIKAWVEMFYPQGVLGPPSATNAKALFVFDCRSAEVKIDEIFYYRNSQPDPVGEWAGDAVMVQPPPNSFLERLTADFCAAKNSSLK